MKYTSNMNRAMIENLAITQGTHTARCLSLCKMTDSCPLMGFLDILLFNAVKRLEYFSIVCHAVDFYLLKTCFDL